jgi:hypothetical protein
MDICNILLSIIRIKISNYVSYFNLHIKISNKKSMYLKQTILILTLFTYINSINLFNKIEISNKTGAACLDGSNPAFYLWEPDNFDTPVNKVLIYFDETPFGWCVR